METNARIELIRKYFHLVEAFDTDPQAFADIFHPDIVQTEYPNLITKATRHRTKAEMLSGATAGKQLLKQHRFEILNSIECGDTLVVEQKWTGEMAINAGQLKEGQVLTAYICAIFEFKDGKIFRQRNYDCYEPF